MENQFQLVKTDTLMYRVKRFFRMLFIKKPSKLEQIAKENNSNINEQLNKIISCKTEVQEIDIQKQLAQKLVKNELPIKELSDEESEKMIEYFEEHIKVIEKELDLLKKSIIELKNKSGE